MYIYKIRPQNNTRKQNKKWKKKEGGKKYIGVEIDIKTLKEDLSERNYGTIRSNKTIKQNSNTRKKITTHDRKRRKKKMKDEKHRNEMELKYNSKCIIIMVQKGKGGMENRAKKR